MYSEKTKKFCEISTLFLSYVVPVKSKLEISQNFVAFSEYMNFTILGTILEPSFCKKQQKVPTKKLVKGIGDL